MTRALLFFVSLWIPLSLTAAEPAAPSAPKHDKKIVIRLPAAKTTPLIETPVVNKDAPVTVGAGQYYVIGSTVPLLPLQRGTGKVAINGETGSAITARKPPLMLPTELVIGWEADATDKEFVKWGEEWPYLYMIKADTKGPVELQLIPALNQVDEKGQQLQLTLDKIVVQSFDVTSGKGPQPPPQPDVSPEPKPVPPPAPKPDDSQPSDKPAAWVIVIENRLNRTPAQGKLLADPYWEKLKASGVKYRHISVEDPIVSEKNYSDYTPAGGTPYVLTMDADGTVLKSFKLPDTIEAIDTKVKGGGK